MPFIKYDYHRTIALGSSRGLSDVVATAYLKPGDIVYEVVRCSILKGAGHYWTVKRREVRCVYVELYINSRREACYRVVYAYNHYYNVTQTRDFFRHNFSTIEEAYNKMTYLNESVMRRAPNGVLTRPVKEVRRVERMLKKYAEGFF